jgi:hypothetical protein
MIVFTQISPPHPLQNSSEMTIFLTIVLSKIEALGTRKKTGPDLGIECVGDGLDSLILAVLSYRREL